MLDQRKVTFFPFVLGVIAKIIIADTKIVGTRRTITNATAKIIEGVTTNTLEGTTIGDY